MNKTLFWYQYLLFIVEEYYYPWLQEESSFLLQAVTNMRMAVPEIA
jgi:hypothetical protein